MIDTDYEDYLNEHRFFKHQDNMMEKKIDTTFTCDECGNSDNDTLMILRDAPHVVECMQCGHPNDARWDHDMIDIYRSCVT